MKILQLNTFDKTGGAAIACLRLHKALKKKDIQSKALIQQPQQTQEGVYAFANSSIAKKLAFVRFALERIHFLFHERSKEVRFAFSPATTGVSLAQHPLILEADIIHLHWINFGYLSIESLGEILKLGKPVVWTLHDMWMFTGGCHHSGECDHYINECGNCKFLKKPSDNDLSHRVHLRKQLAYANSNLTIVPCSEWLAARARKSSLLKNTKVQPIPNPLDINIFYPTEKSEARKKLGLPADKKFILFLAMKISAAGKGFTYFNEALQILKQNYPEKHKEIELLILGSGEPEMLESLPFTYHNLGHVSDPLRIAQVYAAANVFVLPSLEENLPNTIMESLACGTPVTAFNIGGVPEMIAHKQTGYLSEYKSSESLSQGIDWVLYESDENALSRNARQKVLDNYTEEKIASRYVQLYQEILSKN